MPAQVRRSIAAALAIVFAHMILPVTNAACAQAPTPDPLTGHYYELTTETYFWDAARVEAVSRTFGGEPGHLVTISTVREHSVVRRLNDQFLAWLGLVDSTSTSTIDGFDYAKLGTEEQGDTSGSPDPLANTAPVSGERGFGFQWINGDPYTFQLWGPGEPGDAFGGEDGVEMRVGGVFADLCMGATVPPEPGSGPCAFPTVRRAGIEYDVELPDVQRLDLLERRPDASFMGTGSIANLADANALLALPSGHTDIAMEATDKAYVLSFHDPDAGGGLSTLVRSPILTDSLGLSDENLAFRALGQVVIPTAGDWTFAASHNSSIRVVVGNNSFTSEDGVSSPSSTHLFRTGVGNELIVAPGGSGDVFHFPDAGTYEISVTWAYGAPLNRFLQLFASPGDVSEFDEAIFPLVGDNLNDGLIVLGPEVLFADGFESGDTSAWSNS